MGAESRVDYLQATGNKDTAKDAYHRACDRAQMEHGSMGYTGSIAEAAGFLMAGTRPLLKWEAERMGDELITLRKVDKWGPCMLIPVAETTGARTLEIEVDVTGLMNWRDINDKIAGTVRHELRSGEEIESLNIQDGETKSKIVATPTEGKAVTKYAIQTRNEWHYFETLTEAKAWATKALERDRWNTEYQIIKRTVRESGEPLAVVKRVPVKTTKKVTATVGKPGAKTAGWMAAGVYSC